MRLCIIVPTFNHGEPLGRTLESLHGYGFPIIVVDDGSLESERPLIRDAADRFGAILVALPVNQGKGGAVTEGFRVAHTEGFTHAVQVDADGQHDARDVAALVEAAKKNPSALIAGQPVFDESVPGSRLYGRRLTNFWVSIETLSASMPDAMCGLRVYPLDICRALMRSVRLSRRMDFDIEIMVRLAWKGVPIVPVPTRVRYFEDGTSNFRLVRDNWLITKLHTRLFFGMLMRLPAILRSRSRSARGGSRKHWSRIGERGGVLGMRTIFAVYRVLGRRAFRLALLPVISYFYLTAGNARAASREYLARVDTRLRDMEIEPRVELTPFRHFLAFGDAILDKGAMWADSFDGKSIRFADPSVYEQLRSEESGICFIGSHLGNLELLRAFGEMNQKMTVHALVYTRHSRNFVKMLSGVNPRVTEHMIEVDSLGPESVLKLKDKIEAGEHVAIVGDRTSTKHEDRSVQVPFLGEPAPFPEGPFIVAHLLGCPVYLIFCLREADGYRIHLEKFADSIELPRQNRPDALHRVVARYARRLEHYCLEQPLQWFNFFDFWHNSHHRGQRDSAQNRDR